jgi:hypothetical protein
MDPVLNGHTLTPEERMAAMAAADDIARRLQAFKAPQREVALDLARWIIGQASKEERIA